jgi:hypothetical protein
MPEGIKICPSATNFFSSFTREASFISAKKRSYTSNNRESHPPPPVHDLLPRLTHADEEIQLNIDVPMMIGKMNMSVPVVEMCKIPFVRREVLKGIEGTK